MKRFPILLLSSVVTLATASGCREDATEETKETTDREEGTDPEVSFGSCRHSEAMTVCRLRDPKATKPDVGATVTLPKLVVTSNKFSIGKATDAFYVADQVSDAGKYAGMLVTYGKSAGVTAPLIGDVIDLEGTYKPYKSQAQVQLVKYEKAGTATPKVTDVSEAEIATGGAAAAALNGSLVRVKDVTVAKIGDLPGANGKTIKYSFQLSKLIVSSKLLRNAHKDVVVGNSYSEITGILRVGVTGYDEGISTLNPRWVEDLKKKDSVTPPPPPTGVVTTIEAAAKTPCTDSQDSSCLTVSLKGMVITEHSYKDGQYYEKIWVQDPTNTSGKYAAIQLYRVQSQDPLAVGDVLDVNGKALKFHDILQLAQVRFTKTGSGKVVKPVEGVNASEIAPDAIKDNPYQGTLMKLAGPLTVTTKCVLTNGEVGNKKHPAVDRGAFMVADNASDPVLIGMFRGVTYSGIAPYVGVQPTCDVPRPNDKRTVGDTFTSITGVLIANWGRLELTPRNNDDLDGPTN